MVPDFSQVPDELQDVPRWILWRWAKRGDALVKIPTRPSLDGNASAMSAHSWLLFDEAIELLRIATVNNTWGGGGGIGLVFDHSDDLGGVDLDGALCPRTGRLAGWAQEVLDRFSPSWVEVSPSGKGLHTYARGAPESLSSTTCKITPAEGDPIIKSKEPAIEAFVARRFFTCTGITFRDAPRTIGSHPKGWKWLAERMGSGTAISRRKAGRSRAHGEPDLDLVADALFAFTSDAVDRNRFVGIGQVLKHEFGDEAEEVWREWMSRSPDDDAEATQRIWEGLHGEPHSMTLGSIFHWAIERGWEPPWRGQRGAEDELDFEAVAAGEAENLDFDAAESDELFGDEEDGA